MPPVETNALSKVQLPLLHSIKDLVAAPSLYASAGLMLSTGYAGHFYHAAGLVQAPVQPGMPIPPTDWRFALIQALAVAALVSFPVVFFGSISQARRSAKWRFVVLNVLAGIVWFVGLF